MIGPRGPVVHNLMRYSASGHSSRKTVHVLQCTGPGYLDVVQH